MEAGFYGCHLRSGQKGGQAVGLTRRGKGTKVMMVIDGAGIPLATLVESAQKAEVHLAEPVLDAIRVPRTRGRPLRNAPAYWWPTKAMTVRVCAVDFEVKASAPASPGDGTNAPGGVPDPT